MSTFLESLKVGDLVGYRPAPHLGLGKVSKFTSNGVTVEFDSLTHSDARIQVKFQKHANNWHTYSSSEVCSPKEWLKLVCSSCARGHMGFQVQQVASLDPELGKLLASVAAAQAVVANYCKSRLEK